MEQNGTFKIPHLEIWCCHKHMTQLNSTDEKSRSADTKVGVREFAETGSEGSFRCGDPLP